MTPEDVLTRAKELAASGATAGAAAQQLVADAGGDRAAVEEARDRVVTRLHATVGDFEATASLQLLNRTLSAMPRFDPLDWRVRWGQRFRKP